MSTIPDVGLKYDTLMNMYQDYHDTYSKLYRLNTYDECKLLQIYQMVKRNLIDKNIFMPDQILSQISKMFKYNNRYLMSYWFIFKMIYEEFKPEKIDNISTVFNYFVYHEYGTILSFRKKPRFKYLNYISIYVHDVNNIFKAIMNDDIISFIGFTQDKDFDAEFSSHEGYSLIELCCYHGAVKCFKFLITEFKPKITDICVQFSFLSGKPDIISECLKYCSPSSQCMKYAIISHNIDFVSFLWNEYGIHIKTKCCGRYKNIQAFLIDVEDYDNIYKCLIYSPLFRITSLVEMLFQYLYSCYGEGIDFRRALDFAIYSNSRDIFTIFFPQCKHCYLHETIELFRKDSVEIAKVIIDNEKNLDPYYYYFDYRILELAFEYNSINLLKYIVSLVCKFCEKCPWYTFNNFYVEKMKGNNVVDFLNNCYPSIIPHLFKYALNCKGFETFENLIAQGPNIMAEDGFGNTAIHIAAKCERTENNELEYLITHGADPNAKNCGGNTPLHLLMERIDVTIKEIEYLIDHGAEINAKNNDGNTSLHLLIMREDLAINEIEYLIDHGAEINAENCEGNTPLLLMMARKDVTMKEIEYLIDHGAEINAENCEGNTPLLLMMARKDVTMKEIEYLIDHGAEINAENCEGNTPLLLMMAKKDVTMKEIEYLIDHGAEINSKDYEGNTPLLLMMKKDVLTIRDIEYFISHGADINAKNNEGNTPLLLMTMQVKVAHNEIEYLLDHGANINATNDRGNTPLLIMMMREDIINNEIEYLIDHGANINAKNNQGNTPLIIAAKTKKIRNSILEKILSLGGDKDAKDIKENTPLHYAVSLSEFKKVESLVTFGANVNIKNKKDQTAVQIATRKNMPTIVELLLKYGADPCIKDNKGEYALGIAQQNKFKDILKLFYFNRIHKNYKTHLQVSSNSMNNKDAKTKVSKHRMSWAAPNLHPSVIRTSARRDSENLSNFE